MRLRETERKRMKEQFKRGNEREINRERNSETSEILKEKRGTMREIDNNSEEKINSMRGRKRHQEKDKQLKRENKDREGNRRT